MILRAGALEATYRDGQLWHLRVGRHEVAQRIYGAVRDQNWGTVPGQIEIVVLTDRSIVFDSIHQHEGIDFRWRGTIAGSPDCTISFEMRGRAHSSFLRNRIGLCVHHPLPDCVGVPCNIEATDGAITHSKFPELVSPHQPFLNMRSIRYGGAQISFEGEVFETEDQRNWTDANFKTYGTPLSLPFPAQITAGTEVWQRITVNAGDVPRTEDSTNGVVTVRACGPARPMPAFGLALGATPLTDFQRSALERLGLSHVRVDGIADIRRANEEAGALGTQLEIAVTLPCSMPAHLPQAARWLLYQPGQKASGAAAARALRDSVGENAIIAVGTDAYFAELNRNRPDGDGWDAVCFSVNPQVHAFDDESVMMNAAAHRDVVATARTFAGGRGVVASPITLRPRFNPDATGPCDPPPPDPRQSTEFCAAWTVASLQALATAGASSVTYFETHGPRGVMDGDNLFPVYRVFEALEPVFTRCSVTDDRRVAALAFGRRHVVANLTPADCQVEVAGTKHTLGPYSVQNIEG